VLRALNLEVQGKGQKHGKMDMLLHAKKGFPDRTCMKFAIFRISYWRCKEGVKGWAGGGDLLRQDLLLALHLHVCVQFALTVHLLRDPLLLFLDLQVPAPHRQAPSCTTSDLASVQNLELL